MNRPIINVTPLIDVLLVLLIVFMCIAPLKPTAFHARIPSESRESKEIQPATDALVVILGPNRLISLKNESGMGTPDDTDKLVERLRQVFADRVTNGNVSSAFANAPDRPYTDKAERTVFIKAPKSLDYGSVARVVDAAKLAGAYPISLQIDRLE